MSQSQRCSKCKKRKLLNKFHKHKRGKYGFNHFCKECSAAYSKNLPKDVIRSRFLKYTYGISVDDYEALLNKQNGACAICGVHGKELPRGLYVDHDHETDKIRGLLCQKCNCFLGLINDRVDILNKAKDYLVKAVK